MTELVSLGRPSEDTVIVSETLVAPLDGSYGATATSSLVVDTPLHPVLAGRYELLGLLGVGGMGSVYRARDRELEETVALKVLRRELVSAPGMLERFRLEVKLARRVTHRNVARVFDIGEHQGDRFLTMELIDGASLGALIAREGALPIARIVEIASGICAGLASAHAAGVVHRDLKPDNVLLASDGRVVVTDFGIARAFRDGDGAGRTQGLLVGTPAYMAPEQVEGAKEIDARADVYALGGVLYELFTGQRAWQGESPIAVAAARLIHPPPDPRRVRPDIPTTCAELVLRCMAQKPDDRFSTVAEVAAALAGITLPLAARAAVAPAPPVGVEAPLAGDKAVAVLPFRNAGPAEDDYLAEELTDDLIDSLSMTRGLKVRSRGAVLRHKGTEQDPRELGRELGVQVVVEGSVRRARGQVRITARLVSVADGFQLWAKRFDRPEREVLSINDEVAHAIAEALTVDREAAAREAPSSPEAVDLYLRARHEYRKFWGDSLTASIALFEQAALLAPRDPMILSGRALALARRAFSSSEGAGEARAAAEAALAVAPNSGDARLALASVLFQLGDARGAAREVRHALVRGPGLADAQVLVARIVVEAGDLPEAILRASAALTLDPGVPQGWDTLARAHALRGDWARAEETLVRARDAGQSASYLTTRARLLMWRGDRDGAVELLRSAQGEHEASRVARMLLGIMVNGRLPEQLMLTRVVGEETSGGLRRRVFFAQLTAEARVYLEDLTGALDALDISVAGGLLDVAWLDGCPLLAPLRGEPRYAAAHATVKARADEVLAAYRAG